MKQSVAKGFLKYIKEQMDDFTYLLDDFYNPEQGWNESLHKRIVQEGIAKRENNWVTIQWSMGKPNPLSHRPKLFKGKDIQFVNNKGDIVKEEEARDPVTRDIKEGYSVVSPDYRWTIVNSVLSVDFIFNSLSVADRFEELFTMRVYMSNSTYIDLPVLGKTCIFIDDIAMGEVDKFDRNGQGTLLSLPVDFVITYPLIEPVKPKYKSTFVQEKKPLIKEIISNVELKENPTENNPKIIRRTHNV